MSKFIVHGGYPIHGEIDALSSKNATLPLIAACLLTDDQCELTGVNLSTDIRVMLRFLQTLGRSVHIENRGEHITVATGKMNSTTLDAALSARIRASNLLLGPILVRKGSVKGYYPGGDNIGNRTLAAHFDGFVQSGYTVDDHPEASYFMITKNNEDTKLERTIFLYEPSVTGTENMILVNVLGEGMVTIDNAACEPHVRDVCVFLNQMGAHIEGIGTNRIIIHKVATLHGATHTVITDPIMIGTFIVFALVTQGDLVLHHVDYDSILPILTALRYFSVVWEFEQGSLHIPAQQELRRNGGFGMYSDNGIYTQPWPMLPSDFLSILMALATQSEGEFLFFEKMFASRVRYASVLTQMGVHITILDDHRARIFGKTSLHHATLTCPDIRSGLLYLACMLSADGESILENVSQIDRDYNKIEDILSHLGAHIQRYEDTV